MEEIVLKPLEYSRPDIFGKVVARPFSTGWVVVCQTSDKDTFFWNKMLGRWDRGPPSTWHTMTDIVAINALQTHDSMLEKALKALANFVGIMEESRL